MVKMGRPMPEERIRYFYRRLRMPMNSEISETDFMYYMIDIFTAATKNTRQVFNIYFERKPREQSRLNSRMQSR